MLYIQLCIVNNNIHGKNPKNDTLDFRLSGTMNV